MNNLASLFLEDNGVLWCCGCNQKRLWYDTTNQRYVPRDWRKTHKNTVSLPIPIKYFVVNKIRIADISCGGWHTLAIDEHYRLFSWGNNSWAQCGLRVSFDDLNPGLIEYFESMKIDKIDCGYYHSFCRTLDGKHYLFGKNLDNECLKDDGGQYADIPFQIDDIIYEKTDGMCITNVKLGCDVTIIIAHQPV